MRFLAPDSPFLHRDAEGHPLIFDRVTTGKSSERPVGLIPDGVLSITHSERDKALLCFLEVDRGTESVGSPKHGSRYFSEKIVNYQAYFRSGKYKRYEKTWKCRFNGFRLLILVNTRTRLASLSRLAQQMPPCDFVWLTEQKRMFEQGIPAEIWCRGGHPDTALQSILGTELSFRCPILEK
jgi:hypothetical protein